MRFFPPRHSAESVAAELIKGLEDGSVTLDAPDKHRALSRDELIAEIDSGLSALRRSFAVMRRRLVLSVALIAALAALWVVAVVAAVESGRFLGALALAAPEVGLAFIVYRLYRLYVRWANLRVWVARVAQELDEVRRSPARRPAPPGDFDARPRLPDRMVAVTQAILEALRAASRPATPSAPPTSNGNAVGA